MATHTAEMVRTAADAIWAAREDAAAEEAGAGPAAEPKGGGESQEATEDAREGVALPDARRDVVEATKALLERGAPFERGVPALWALRDACAPAPVSKEQAAAAYRAVTGKAWPWPPTKQELDAQRAAREQRYPRGLYHVERAAITVHDAKQEADARAEGYLRAREMAPQDWVAAWARETGAGPDEQAQALKATLKDPKRRK